jgi:sarcosine oxidase, subunit beta
MFRTFGTTVGGDAGFHETGMLYLHPESDEAAVRENAERLRGLGISVDVLDADALAAAHPELDLDGVSVGVWEPASGYADPAATTTSLFEAAVAAGVTPRLHTQIAAIEPTAGGGATVVTHDGEATQCNRLLIAAGPWTKPLAAMAGVEVPLTVERHIVATFAWGGAEPVPFGFADLPGGYYCKPEGRDLFCLGHLTEGEIVDADDFRETVSEPECAELAEVVMHRIPALVDAEARGGWASLYDVSPDWQPVIGEIADGIFVDAGTSGHGFKLAPALGRLVADLVTGKPIEPGLEQFRPERFDTGQTLRGGYGEIRILG